MQRPVLFLDDGGVMNENARRAPQWERLVGAYLVPRLGGAPEAWAAANHEVAPRQFQHFEAHFGSQPYASFVDYWAVYEEAWLVEMCTAIGVAPPVHKAERLRMARACAAFVTRRVRSAFPGVGGAIRALHRAGYLLHTGSGEASWELHGYLIGMRVRSCFNTLYGPDQVDIAKFSPQYYERIFAHAGIQPAEALVVDDSERALDWAAEVGAQTVLCRQQPPTNTRHRHIATLAALPGLVG